ncbi:YraN family protein [Novosphingobium malaysiense]|uniref:UPF0102 protein LK12_11815 n=1 Tax=Novosphingobium malaysiense TaxID=1348853 RepID=A0A0B1ZLT2_9SPHN|nr:YraN family protein [Novosphingobium malaysiense]KHK91506.1 hypothetical protein LK12_11815 [Novosphingobium malaysiense]
MSRKRTKAERNGRRGEMLAALFLMMKGWRILGRRVRSMRGEVDIVARRGKTLCFVEVKWRATREELDTAITVPRLRRVAAAAEAIAHRYARPGDNQRVDVILIAPRSWPRRVENAWQPGS